MFITQSRKPAFVRVWILTVCPVESPYAIYQMVLVNLRQLAPCFAIVC